jgi:mRNA-degrading endonuclease RelE of RelBE toxin-antitoxin system
MIVLFERKFLKNIDDLDEKELKSRIEQIIIGLEKAKNLRQIGNLKKLKGHKSAYRIRIGEYRLGFFFENQKVILNCLLHRKDVYKYFP